MQGLIPKVQLLLCWIYIYKGKSTKGNCFQVPCFHFGPLCSCQLIMGTRLEQTQLYGIIKLTTGSLKMSTRESLLCKKQPIKSQRSLWISSLPERRRVDQIPLFTTERMPDGGGRWKISPEQGMFYCHHYSRDSCAAFYTRLHLSHVWMARMPWS